MKTSEARDAMVARANAFAAQYPTLKSVPEAAGPIEVQIAGPRDHQAYIAALYEVAAKGNPVGRDKDGTMLFGGEIKKAVTK